MHMTDMRSLGRTAMGLLATLSGTTPAKGNIVDLVDFQTATIHLVTGTVTDAGAASGFSFEVQESDTTDDADFTAVADADLVGAESDMTVTDDASDDMAIGSLGYVGTKRYVRVVATGTTGTDATVAGIWVLTDPRYAPKGDAAANIAAT